MSVSSMSDMTTPANPEMCGQAKLVPDPLTYPPLGAVDKMSVPGAST